MMIETLGVAIALIAGAAPWRALPAPQTLLAPTFLPAERAVDNWRRESALNLDLEFDRASALALGRDIKGLSRCVRLNNYWCIKKAGWIGEIASDSEGHVAFAGAREGATVAAVLLRRYYLDFNLKSARAIVQRWAPAQCGFATAAAPRRIAGGAVRVAGGRVRMVFTPGRRMLGPEPRGLTTRGLGSTLRAQWLARHGGAGVARKAKGKRVALRRSVVPDRLAGMMMKTPTIAVGLGAIEPVRLAMAPFPGLSIGPAPGAATLLPSLPPLPVTSCASETQRIANYAAAIANGIVEGPDADLALFDAAGQPTANFSRALFNMAAVEIGPLRARQSLVDAALAALPKRPAP